MRVKCCNKKTVLVQCFTKQSDTFVADGRLTAVNLKLELKRTNGCACAMRKKCVIHTIASLPPLARV